MYDFNSLRKAYPEFVYKSYSYKFENSHLNIKYDFEIPGLSSFSPEWSFPFTENNNLPGDELIENLVFSLGMVELISYWKAACPPVVKVIPHGLDSEMIYWWKELYFGGLGEFFYTNGISADFDTFMHISADNNSVIKPSMPLELEGNLVPVGGGKDSSVTLSVLKASNQFSVPYIINSRGATDETCEAAGLGEVAYKVKRTIDKSLIDLNKRGFLNGHTPFSAIVAFSSLIAAVLTKKKYVVLSNESSANESTVLGEDVNHQFSKGEVFEKNFIEYQKKYINCGVEYFSFLRPLSEMQIAALFSAYKEYHSVFRSCNAGSKSNIWCCDCPKCLFVYVILSPFLKTEELIAVFGENLLEKESLLDTYKELTGVYPNKPFECVGSRDEVICASRYTLEKMTENGEHVPYLLEYFKEHIDFESNDMSYYMSFWDECNHLPDEYIEFLQKELREHTKNVSEN